MNESLMLGAKVEPKFHKAFENYAKRRGVGVSVALRQIVSKALEAEGYEVPERYKLPSLMVGRTFSRRRGH